MASRPSVRAITFKPHCRLTRRAPRRRRARSLDVLTCASAPALRVKGRAATRLPSGRRPFRVLAVEGAGLPLRGYPHPRLMR